MAEGHSPSPAQRPQLAQRDSSTQSLSRASPSALTSTSHKGSTHKSHKAHGVGHGRLPHGRLPSYGKNLNRLAKNTTLHVEDAEGQRQQTRSTSPTTQNVKRNSSNINLPRTGSKANAKRNSSGINLQHRNGSAAKLGKVGRTDKLNQGHSKAQPKFSIGSEGQEDDWTEESRSQSPEVVRHEAFANKPAKPAGLPSPDDPPARSPSKLPQSPPQSPSRTDTPSTGQPPRQQPHTRYTRPPDAESVTTRLLSRHNAAPQLSSFSAAVTPLGSHPSPGFSHPHSDTTTLVNTNPSLGADGVSRFLHQAGSSSSGTPGSVSQLQSTLAALHREQRARNAQSSLSPSSNSPPSQTIDAAQRARSAGNLTHPRLGGASSRLPSPPPSRTANQSASRESPFASPRPQAGRKAKEASKSLTQLKLDLQRIASEREAEKKKAAPAPLLQTSHPTLSIGNGLNAGVEGEKERRDRQYEQAERDLANAARFEDIFGKALRNLEKRGLVGKSKGGEEARRDGVRSVTGSLGRNHEDRSSRPPSRGRVRFEVGRMDGEDDEDEQGPEGGARGLLRRMWDGDGAATEEE